MSKYIRTESGIIYVGDLIKDEYGNYCDPKNYETDMEVSNEYIIKEADSIEKLCDGFAVVGYYKNKPLLFNTLYEAQQFVYCNGCQDKDYIKIKGGIWTDKGFIYQAEINDKGGLELL